MEVGQRKGNMGGIKKKRKSEGEARRNSETGKPNKTGRNVEKLAETRGYVKQGETRRGQVKQGETGRGYVNTDCNGEWLRKEVETGRD